jgi:hypothetical protein
MIKKKEERRTVQEKQNTELYLEGEGGVVQRETSHEFTE